MSDVVQPGIYQRSHFTVSPLIWVPSGTAADFCRGAWGMWSLNWAKSSRPPHPFLPPVDYLVKSELHRVEDISLSQ